MKEDNEAMTKKFNMKIQNIQQQHDAIIVTKDERIKALQQELIEQSKINAREIAGLRVQLLVEQGNIGANPALLEGMNE